MDIELLIQYGAPAEQVFEAAKQQGLPYYRENVSRDSNAITRHFFLLTNNKILYLRKHPNLWRYMDTRTKQDLQHTHFGKRALEALNLS